VLPGASTPLESLRGRWQAAAEQFCAARGLPASLLGVVVSELRDDATEVPSGVHKYKQVGGLLIRIRTVIDEESLVAVMLCCVPANAAAVAL
jgi:hypothetical protein